MPPGDIWGDIHQLTSWGALRYHYSTWLQIVHKRHPTAHPGGWAMWCLWWVWRPIWSLYFVIGFCTNTGPCDEKLYCMVPQKKLFVTAKTTTDFIFFTEQMKNVSRWFQMTISWAISIHCPQMVHTRMHKEPLLWLISRMVWFWYRNQVRQILQIKLGYDHNTARKFGLLNKTFLCIFSEPKCITYTSSYSSQQHSPEEQTKICQILSKNLHHFNSHFKSNNKKYTNTYTNISYMRYKTS